MEDREVVVLGEVECVKEWVWWRVGALDVRKPARLRAVVDAGGKVVLGMVRARGWARR